MFPTKSPKDNSRSVGTDSAILPRLRCRKGYLESRAAYASLAAVAFGGVYSLIISPVSKSTFFGVKPGITVGALPIIEQALIGRRQLRGRVTSEGAFCDIFAPVSITQPNQHRL